MSTKDADLKELIQKEKTKELISQAAMLICPNCGSPMVSGYHGEEIIEHYCTSCDYIQSA